VHSISPHTLWAATKRSRFQVVLRRLDLGVGCAVVNRIIRSHLKTPYGHLSLREQKRKKSRRASLTKQTRYTPIGVRISIHEGPAPLRAPVFVIVLMMNARAARGPPVAL